MSVKNLLVRKFPKQSLRRSRKRLSRILIRCLMVFCKNGLMKAILMAQLVKKGTRKPPLRRNRIVQKKRRQKRKQRVQTRQWKMKKRRKRRKGRKGRKRKRRKVASNRRSEYRN